jgi:hypothetical protein
MQPLKMLQYGSERRGNSEKFWSAAEKDFRNKIGQLLA